MTPDATALGDVTTIAHVSGETAVQGQVVRVTVLPEACASTIADVDMLIKGAIRQELRDVHAIFIRVAESLHKVENVDRAVGPAAHDRPDIAAEVAFGAELGVGQPADREAVGHRARMKGVHPVAAVHPRGGRHRVKPAAEQQFVRARRVGMRQPQLVR